MLPEAPIPPPSPPPLHLLSSPPSQNFAIHGRSIPPRCKAKRTTRLMSQSHAIAPITSLHLVRRLCSTCSTLPLLLAAPCQLPYQQPHSRPQHPARWPDLVPLPPPPGFKVQHPSTVKTFVRLSWRVHLLLQPASERLFVSASCSTQPQPAQTFQPLDQPCHQRPRLFSPTLLPTTSNLFNPVKLRQPSFISATHRLQPVVRLPTRKFHEYPSLL